MKPPSRVPVPLTRRREVDFVCLKTCSCPRSALTPTR